jgi:hypothetical protein
MKKSHLGFWFYAHVATVISGIFLIRGELGWVLATFSAACAWLIYKIPKPFLSGFQYVDTGNSYSDGDDSDNESTVICDICSPDLDNLMHDDFWH